VNSVHTVADTFLNNFSSFGLLLIFWCRDFRPFSIVIKYLRIPIQLIGNALSQVFYKDAAQTYQDKNSLQNYFKNLKQHFYLLYPFFNYWIWW